VMARSASREALRHVSVTLHATAQTLPRSVRFILDVDPIGAL
jgi:hypothetical protein